MRRNRHELVSSPVMETALIGQLEGNLEAPNTEGSIISAVLFANGRLIRVENDLKVYGLVMAGYEGLSFGDDGTYTAQVASELPLERWAGTHRLEEVIDAEVKKLAPDYAGECVGFISAEKASVLYRAFTKHGLGVPVERSELFWDMGSLTLS